MPKTYPTEPNIQRPSAEQRYRTELDRLREADTGACPDGWQLSPKAVRSFIIGDDSLGVTRKFYGDDALVDRCIVTLLSNRALLLVGEPGTAKSMLSELLTAAISGTSELTVQGSAGTSQDNITYSWNYALLIAHGPSIESLVPSPVYRAMQDGLVVRCEEITRVQPEISDVLIGVLSDRVLRVPEIPDHAVPATAGFNVIGTANLKDRGVQELSSALKRRFSFETVKPIKDRRLEAKLITQNVQALLAATAPDVAPGPDVVEMLVTTFQELRTGRTENGTHVERPTTVMSTAEAVAVAHAACLDAAFLGEGQVTGAHITRQLLGTVMKDNEEDGKKLRNYYNTVVKERAADAPESPWQQAYSARGDLG